MPIVLLLISLFILPSMVYSGSPQYQDVVIHNARTSTGTGTMVNVHDKTVVRVDVQITGSAEVEFQVAGAGNFGPYSKLCTPSNDTARVASTTTTGVFYCEVAGANVFVAPVLAYTSGTVTVIARATTGF